MKVIFIQFKELGNDANNQDNNTQIENDENVKNKMMKGGYVHDYKQCSYYKLKKILLMNT